MRILHILNQTRNSNGHVHAAIDLACVQSKMGHAVFMVSGGGDFDDVLERHGVRHIKIDLTRRFGNLVRAVFRLRSTFAALSPDIVHAHMVASALLSALLRPLMKFKLVTTVQNEFQKEAILMRVGNRVVAVSDAGADQMERRGVPRKKLRVVMNGTIGSPRLDPGTPQARALQHPAITFVGGLHPRKGVADLIEAFRLMGAHAPTAHLYLVGAGPYRQAYEEQAAQSGVGDRIEFCGSQRDPRPYLLGSDLFVLASLADPAPLVVSEARDAGCAIVATSVDGIPEMLDHGKAGVLVPPQRPDLLSAAILNIILHPDVLADLRRRSQANVERFTVERVAQESLAIYQELLR
jgi:glycosyltransferase involved in cell wall biosynthesis